MNNWTEAQGKILAVLMHLEANGNQQSKYSAYESRIATVNTEKGLSISTFLSQECYSTNEARQKVRRKIRVWMHVSWKRLHGRGIWMDAVCYAVDHARWGESARSAKTAFLILLLSSFSAHAELCVAAVGPTQMSPATGEWRHWNASWSLLLCDRDSVESWLAISGFNIKLRGFVAVIYYHRLILHWWLLVFS